MVNGYHLIWVAYGWWLPNDLRGSMSKVLRNDVLAELGVLHLGRKRIQPASGAIRDFYRRAEEVLKFPLLEFHEAEVRAIAGAFAEVIRARRYTCYACAIMPDHVHVLIRKHRDRAEEMIGHLQAASHLKLRDVGLRDMDHPVWGGRGWKVFLECAEDIRRTIPYIDENPVKRRLPRQRWRFVSPYDGWEGGRITVVR